MKKFFYISFLWCLMAISAIAQDPVVYLPMNSDLKDVSGNHLNGIDMGDVPVAFTFDAVRNDSVAFFATKSYVQITKSDLLRFGADQDFAFSFWFKQDSAVDGDPAVIANKDWGSARNKGFVLCTKADTWLVNFSDGTTIDTATKRVVRLYWNASTVNAPYLSNGQWHFVAVSFDRSDSLRVYLDDVALLPYTGNGGSYIYPLSAAPGVAYDDVNDYPITLMQDGTGAYGSDTSAYMDDLRIWNRTISAEEVDALYHQTSAVPKVGTLMNTSVYPNPVSNVANLTFSMQASRGARILIYNNIGVLVKDIAYSGTKGQNRTAINVKGWESGLYFVKVVSGSSAEVVRFVVAK